MDAHETLGIAPDASAEEATQAYRRLARELHPDVHPGSSPEQRARYESSMAEVNRAYHQIARHTERWRPRDQRAPGRGECALCGHAPAAMESFDYQEGVLFSRRRYSFGSTLCRECSRAVGRAYQDRTLGRGWWGPTLFVTNVGVVAGNTRALRRAGRLADPAPVPDVQGGLATPMPPGHPVVLRSGAWVLPLVIALVLCLWLGLRVLTAS